LYLSLRFEVPGLQGRKVIFGWTNLCLPVEGDAFLTAKAIDDGDRSTVLPARVITNINDKTFQGSEITSNLIESDSQTLLFDSFQLKDANVAKFFGPAVVKHPSLGLPRLAEPMADKSFLGRLEKLLDLSLCKLFIKFGLFLWVEISRLLMPVPFDLQLDMTVIQRTEHLTEDIEKLFIACLVCDFWSVPVVLFFPVDIPQLKKWVSVVKGVPQGFEIPFRVANHD
jgi:hypothetical protein